MKRKIKPLGYERKKVLSGYLFILPWLLGFIFLFLRPIIESIIYSVTNATVSQNMKGDFIGIENYIKAFTSDSKFVKLLSDELVNLLYHVPVILAFSVFLACVLNQKFYGRTLMRAVFFIPVIAGSGIILQIMSGDAMSQSVINGTRSSMLFKSSALSSLMLEMGLDSEIVNFLSSMVSEIFNLTWKSGLQIFLLIGGLNAIPPHLYEAAHIEGANSWEAFWKITFPMISPMMILATVYTIIDNFTDYSNDVMKYILDFSKRLEFSYGATLSWIYFLIVAIVVSIIYFIINRRVTYVEK